MGHDITMYRDEGLTQEIAHLRLAPSEARTPGNIYDILGCADFRRSCSGSGGVAEIECIPGEELGANSMSNAFLEQSGLHPGERAWIKFA